MGEVYQAVQKSTGRMMAVKTLLPEEEVPEQDLRLFLREASVLGQLDHRRIVRFFEFGIAGGVLYLVMEYVETVALPSLLAEQSEASRLRTYCGLICQVLEGLEYAHKKSLVHRDIKPANILITRLGKKLRAKIADFGLAKNFTNAGFSGITVDGQTRGTVAFMPPEQILNCRYSGPACDIFAVGATLYTFLAGGRLPYEFASADNTLLVALQCNHVPLLKRNPALPPDLAALVHRAMAREPADRFESALQMREALLPFARPPTP
jgi:serine/threonine protein kinase